MLARLPTGVVIGNRHVIRAKMATLAACSARTLPGEDVIRCGDGRSSASFGASRWDSTTPRLLSA